MHPPPSHTRKSKSGSASPRGRDFKVAMVAACPFPTQQGTQVFVRHLAGALFAAGVQIELFAYHNQQGDSPPLPYPVRRSWPLGARSSWRSGPSLTKPLSDLGLISRLWRPLTTQRFDIIHVHGLEALALLMPLRGLLKAPLLYHAHTCMAQELPTYFQNPWLRRGAQWLGGRLEASLPAQADYAIAFDADKKRLLTARGAQAERIALIPPGLQMAELRDIDYTLKAQLRAELGKGPWLLYAGNPDGYQNLPLLWQALRLVRSKRPDVRLLILPPLGSEKAFAELAAQAGCSDAVAIRSYKNTQEMATLFSLCDVGLCPRRLWSGVPIKLLNYLAADLPTVACRDAAAHLLTDDAGLLLPADATLFAEGILQILGGIHSFKQGVARLAAALQIDRQIPLYLSAYADAQRARRQRAA